jgi:hypothetical protein
MGNIHKPPLKKAMVGKSALKITQKNKLCPHTSVLWRLSCLRCVPPLWWCPLVHRRSFCWRRFHRRCLLYQSLCLCRRRFQMSTKDSSLMMLTIKRRRNPRNKNQNSPLWRCPLVWWRSFCRCRLHRRCLLYQSLHLCRRWFRTSTKDLSWMMLTIAQRLNPKTRTKIGSVRYWLVRLVGNQERMPEVHPHHEPPRHSRRTNHFSP